LRERNSGGSPCVADEDMTRLAPSLRQIAPHPAGGAWADLAQLVLKIGDAQKQFRDPMAAQLTSESMSHMRALFSGYVAADASKPLSREDEFLLGSVEEALFLLREDILRKSLSAADADFLWSGIRSLVKRVPRRGEYVSAVEALRVQLGKPVDPDLQQVFSDSVVAEPMHFSYREDDDGSTVPKLVRDLPPPLRKKMVESIKQKLCVADSPSDMRSLALLLSAALRDDWNHAPWPAFRLSWMATPMALGADDALLDDSSPHLPKGDSDTEIEWALWNRFSAFRTQHGLPAFEEENVMSQCVAQSI